MLSLHPFPRIGTLLGGLLLAIGATLALHVQAAIQLDNGLLQDVATNGDGIRVFKGIPYAAPPVGALRWRAPEPVVPWQGERPANQWGPRCVQSNRLGPMDPLNPRMSEDCLYLNVWTPAKPGDAPLPVMVWIHGGSNTNGSASQPEYEATALARQGVIVVTLNYRLDIFGFLAHPELTAESGATKASGNYGLLDQIAALHWVQRHAAAFGGDPRQVTVFGESAGAIDISLLLTSPLTKGLFARAIGESGGALSRLAPFAPKPLNTGEAEGLKLAQSVGAVHLAELRNKPASELMDAVAKSPITYGLGVIDGHVVPDHPATLFARGAQHDVPMLIGFNSDEGSLFAARMKAPSDATSLAQFLGQTFKEAGAEAVSLYPAGQGVDGARSAFTSLMGDQIIGYGSWAWAEQSASPGRSPVYRYHFTRRPPGAPALSLFPLAAPGVYHFAEILYVFNHLDLRPEWGWTQADHRLAQTMSAYWVQFAKTGNPNANGLARWEPFVPGGTGQVMELGERIGMQPEPNRARFEFLHRQSNRLAPR